MNKRTRDCERRQVLLDILRSRHDHPDAMACYREIRLQIPNIGQSTVYRHLDTLVAQNLIREIRLDGGPARYDAQSGTHAHFYCDACRTIADVDCPEISLSWPGRAYDVTVIAHGICLTCQTALKKNTDC